MVSRLLLIVGLFVSIAAIAYSVISKTIWAHGFNILNCPKCEAKIDWSNEKGRTVVGKKEKNALNKDGMVLLKQVLDIDKVRDLEKEVDGLPNTFMSDVLVKTGLPYSRYEHHLDTRSELVRDWAVHGPLGKWAAELLEVESVRLYNAEAIYHAGSPCNPAWHRDTIAAPFPTNVRSITFNVYLDDIGADAPNGDGLIYMKGSHKDLSGPPKNPKILEPYMKVGDLLAHDPHTYHTTSGRGCWERRSLQFRYVATVDSHGQPTTFQFGMNRFPHGPIPWSLAQAPELFPHGLSNGDILSSPAYPVVYPKPLDSEHISFHGNVWTISKVINMLGESEKMSVAEDGSIPEGFYFLDGPVINNSSWTVVENPNNGITMPMHIDSPGAKAFIKRDK